MMLGVLVETEEATDYCSHAIPVPKPNSDPLKCRWVTDFRNLNMALKRPVWGGESSYQLLRHIDPKAKYLYVLLQFPDTIKSVSMKKALDY